MYNDYFINAPPWKWKIHLEEHKFGATVHATHFWLQSMHFVLYLGDTIEHTHLVFWLGLFVKGNSLYNRHGNKLERVD